MSDTSDQTGQHGGETVRHAVGDTELCSYLARPPAPAANGAGLILVHEWWGLNDQVRGVARRLAREGYVVLAVDVFGNGAVADDPGGAAELMNGIVGNIAAGEERLRAALDQLAALDGVDAGRIGAVGHCFGGAMVLHMARSGMNVRGVVSFHGALAPFTPAAPGVVQSKVLVLHGAADAMVPMADLSALEAEMAAAGVDCRTVVYEGAQHGFTRAGADADAARYGLPIGYDFAADRASWREMQRFFQEVL